MQEKMNMRQRAIIAFLAEQRQPVTLAAIAGEINVSSKTVMRDLAEIENLLDEYGAKLTRKQGQGIFLKAGEPVRKILLERFSDKARTAYSPKERQTLIVGRLLQSQEPVKLYEFTTLLKVSEATVSKDLDKLAAWFSENKLELIRRPGLGIYVNGSENHIRKAIVYFIYENINEEQLIEMLHDSLAESSRRRLLNLVNTEIIQRIKEVIKNAASQMNFKLSDRSFVGLTVHMALAVQRMQKNEKIVIDEKVLARLKSCREFLVSEKIAAGIEEEFLLNVPESEIGYITMHLMGARNQLNDGAVNKFRLVCLARDLIKAAQELTGSRLVGNNKLLIDLVNHLSPAISRMKLKMEIRNPLLKEMKARYGSLMEMSRKAAAPLERELKLSFPEEEIAYLAMHIGAAMEEAAIKEKKKYRAVVACPTGIGSSRLLASRIKKEFARIEVVGTASVLNLDADALKRERVDFILSTTALNNAPLKAVQVSALLAESDRARIEKAIGELDENKASEDILDAAGDFKNSLARHINYGRAIYSLIENFFYLECGGESVAALIELVGDALREKGADKEKVKADLKGREAINSTVIDEPSIMLLHCETRGILTPHFGIIRAAGAIGGINNDMSNDVMAAAVMLLPKEHDGETAELMGHITEMLVENVSFSQSILFSSGDVCRREFTQGLRQFYITKNKLIMEEE